MDDAPLTVTGFGIATLVVIFLIVLGCHYLGPRATTWIRSNKEEKIGLSKNKLFHANGYMIHSGSEFLLSTSGSFKRFDTVDPDYRQAGQNPAQRTSPLWNLPQADNQIPPQPLRPAPAPSHPPPFSAGSGKSVTFSFDALQEPGGDRCMETTLNGDHGRRPSSSCMRPSNHVPSALPQPIEAPPPPRLSAQSPGALSASAIPRPVAKKPAAAAKHQMSTNGDRIVEAVINDQGPARDSTARVNSHGKHLTRRNSSTNPFLCESVDSAQGNEDVPCNGTANTGPSESQSGAQTNGNNPFYDEGANGNGPYGSRTRLDSTATSCEVASGGATTQAKPALGNHLFRNRSFSETEASDPNLTNFSSKLSAVGSKLTQNTNPFASLSKKVKGPHLLQKTFSEDFLFRNIPGGGAALQGSPAGSSGSQQTWTFGRSFFRQDSFSGMGRRNSSQASLDSTAGSMDSIILERAISCDSVNSEFSVALSDLEQPHSQITGYLCIGLQYDKSSMTEEGMELVVNVVEAKQVLCPFNVESFDTFVRIYLVPDQAGAMQTKVVTNTLSPIYNESFSFWLKKQQGRHSLWFHLYHNGQAHTLLGEAEMEIGEMPCPVTTWIPLSDSRRSSANWGELMFSLSYLPTAERLTIVVVKARNLRLDVRSSKTMATEVQNIFVKVYLMNNEKKILKKRTSLKRKDRCPIFNESMIFSLPPQGLTTVQLRLTVFGAVDQATVLPLGHVIVGSCATGKGLRHWHQMLSSLRKPVAMWHVLRRATNQPVFTGGAEAVVAVMQSQSTATRAKRNSIF